MTPIRRGNSDLTGSVSLALIFFPLLSCLPSPCLSFSLSPSSVNWDPCSEVMAEGYKKQIAETEEEAVVEIVKLCHIAKTNSKY